MGKGMKMIGETFNEFRCLAVFFQGDPQVANAVDQWFLCMVERTGEDKRYLGLGIYWE